MPNERAAQAIQTKYESLPADLIGEDPETDERQWRDTSLWYRIFRGGMIITDGGRAALFVPTRILSLWISHALCDRMGYVRADPATLAGGVSQRFSAGTAFLADGARVAVLVWDGPIHDKYVELGGAEGELGFPTSSRRRSPNNELDGVDIWTQAFQNGQIATFYYAETGETECLAVDLSGASLPRKHHRIIVETIRCIEETDGLGSDEAGFSFVTSPMASPSTVQRWFHGDADSGESFSPGLVLYDGPLKGALALSLVGLEKDGPRAYTAARGTFEETMLVLDQDLTEETAAAITPVLLGVTLVGIAVGASLGATTVIVTAEGVISIAGAGAAGGAIGLLVAIALLVIIIPPIRWRGTELLAVDRIVYLGDLLTRPSALASRLVSADDVAIEGTPLRLSVAIDRTSRTRFTERRTYRNRDEDSSYQINLVHDIT